MGQEFSKHFYNFLKWFIDVFSQNCDPGVCAGIPGLVYYAELDQCAWPDEVGCSLQGNQSETKVIEDKVFWLGSLHLSSPEVHLLFSSNVIFQKGCIISRRYWFFHCQNQHRWSNFCLNRGQLWSSFSNFFKPTINKIKKLSSDPCPTCILWTKLKRSTLSIWKSTDVS